MNKKIGTLTASMLLALSTQAMANHYTLPQQNEALIGKIIYTKVPSNNNVVNIAKQYDIGYNALQNANPQFNLEKSFPNGATIQIPTSHLLPTLSRKGIIVNLPEMRMYYFPPNSDQVFTYPIGIGKIGKTIPITMTSITYKKQNPNWIAPEDIREFDLKTQGLVVPQVVPPGPDNPLGPYAIYMRVPTYLIHSTIFPESIGKRASFGCIRMYESDVATLFSSVQAGIPVAIINEPVKVAWQANHLYLEAYEPLEEHKKNLDANLPGIVHAIQEARSSQKQPLLVDWQLVAYVAQERDGIPHDVAVRVKAVSRG